MLTALFLLVVLGAMCAFVMALSTTAQQSATLDYQGSRAYQAARGGMEYALYQALSADVCTSSNLTLDGTMTDFAINLQCTRSTHNQAGNTVTVYQVVSTACNLAAGATCGPSQRSANYVERQVSGAVAKCIDSSGGACS